MINVAAENVAMILMTAVAMNVAMIIAATTIAAADFR
jgi:hypothetical protein